MNAYSEDLRKKIVEAVERGMPKIEAARAFGVGISSVKRYVATVREGKPLAPKRRPGSKPKLDEGARKLLEAYVEKALAPSLRAAQVVVMDNLSAHKAERIRELIEGKNCELVYLPPYSPDLNPIEQAFSKLKGLLRGAEARSREALIEAMGVALSAVTAQDASGFFRYCGYRSPAQLL